MGKYYTDSKAFNGHIMAEFKFNILDVFSQHLKVHNSAVLSFKPNEIVIQTMGPTGAPAKPMCENMDKTKDDIDIKGFYTATIPSESLEEYDFDCNIPEIKQTILYST